MKIIDIINQVKENMPNGYSDETLCRWIAEVDGFIALDVMLMDIEEAQIVDYRYPEAKEYEPLVRFPHDGIYDAYLRAQICLANGEYNKYQNEMEAYNSKMNGFQYWFKTTYDPVQGYRKEEHYAV